MVTGCENPYVMQLKDEFGWTEARMLNNGWLKIYVNDVHPSDFFQYPYASKWIALNILAVDDETVIVDKWQSKLIRDLESLKFNVIPLELRHSRTLGGGFHCVTLDLIRNIHG